MSKRTRKQCGAPAMRGKRVCRFHGGLSTGPKSAEGRARCAAAKA
ncbi:MAG: HGGxSTG domain-containing protein, partial [Proteobacteria bacterium]|nr:HGGxSTG domain-containing protein [Pseudomonadota bacterium]